MHKYKTKTQSKAFSYQFGNICKSVIISYITTIDSSRHKVPTTWYGSDQTHMPYVLFFG